MINERMIELLLLSDIVNNAIQSETDEIIYFNNKPYNAFEMIKRYNELTAEFIEPYVIDSDPKG
jgi:hypothetical protein